MIKLTMGTQYSCWPECFLAPIFSGVGVSPAGLRNLQAAMELSGGLDSSVLGVLLLQ